MIQNTNNILSPKHNDLNFVYNTNIQNTIDKLEMQQILNLQNNNNKPEYLLQFDELKFDNVKNPISFNDTKGLNKNLQREMEFRNAYSNFQNTDMHYDVINNDSFNHNNMTPNTSRRDISNIRNKTRNHRRLELFTGSFSNYTEKKEKYPLFKPIADLSWINGIPSITNAIENRFLPSNKNNYGNLPFDNNLRIKPGLENENQRGTYAVYRVNPQNIDTLRSQINQKVSYLNKPLETIKIGEVRAPDPALTTYKLQDFREQTIADLLPSKSTITKSFVKGKFTDIKTQRNEKENYLPGPKLNISYGDAPNKEKSYYQKSKKENFLNDINHGITSVLNKPMLCNTSAYKVYENQRFSTNYEDSGNINSINSNYSIDYKNKPNITLKDQMLFNDNLVNFASQNKNNYIFSNNMVLPITNRQSTQNKDILGPNRDVKANNVISGYSSKPSHRLSTSHNLVLNSASDYRNVPVYNEDQAKNTIRPEISHNLVLNTISDIRHVPIYNNDQAKITQRPEISHNLILNTNSNNKHVPIYNNDQAKITQRPEISHNLILNTNSNNKHVPIYNNDQAKITQRPEISHNLILNTDSKIRHVPIYNNDQAKITQKPEISHNLPSQIKPPEHSSYLELKEKLRPTLKETQLITTPEINIKGETYITYSSLQDDLKPTIKNTTIINNRINNINTNTQNYIIDKKLKAKTTLRETNSVEQIGNLSNNNLNYIKDNTFKARNTIKETTENKMNIANVSSSFNDLTYIRSLDHKAKPTLKEVTENTISIGHVNNKSDAIYVKSKELICKPTIKESLLHMTPEGRINQNQMANYVVDKNDKLKSTKKETTLLEDYLGNAVGEINDNISHMASDNMTIDDKKEQTTKNRTPNGKADLHGPYINKETVVLHDPILFSYLSHPHQNLDFSAILPDNDYYQENNQKSEEFIENVQKNESIASYHINSNFINTLNDNHLVNDIYHQKNIIF